MGAKDADRALLDRLPDDRKLDEVIEQIGMLGGPWLDESIAHHKQHPERTLPWREALRK